MQNVLSKSLDFLFYIRLEVRGPSGPQLLVGGPSGHLDFVLRALRALRPCHPDGVKIVGYERTNKAFLGVG